MKLTTWMMSAFACATLAACGGASDANDGKPTTGSLPSTTFEIQSLGNEDAPVVMVEYASVTCVHCAHFHNEILPDLKPRIEAGELRLEFREFLTAPGDIAMAGFQIARCAGDDKYFEVLEDLFSNQTGIMTAARNRAGRGALLAVAQRHGLNEEQFNVCVRDQKLFDFIDSTMNTGIELGVNSTPTLIIDGEFVDRTAYTAEGLNALIDQKLGIEPAVEEEAEAAEVVEETEAETPTPEETATEE